MNRPLLAALLLVMTCVSSLSWSNGGQSTDVDHVLFGTHDYIAFKGYLLGGGETEFPWIKSNMNWFFLGTEAPDRDPKIAGGGTLYSDTAQCHCILTDSTGQIVKRRGELRAKQEFDKAKAALKGGNTKMAAFFAGAMAHYVGDLSQFGHVMGNGSQWMSVDASVHTRYEQEVEATIDFRKRTSSLLESFIKNVAVSGETPEAIAVGVGANTERADGIHNPRWMNDHYKQLMKKHKPNAEDWDSDFRNQTGESVNYSINAIAKLLKMIE